MTTTKLSLTLALARKDWRLFWADRRAALTCFAVPVLLASAFGMIFHRPAAEGAGVRLPVAVVVEDGGPAFRHRGLGFVERRGSRVEPG
jgi:ABC-2 type transport system permease protein